MTIYRVLVASLSVMAAFANAQTPDHNADAPYLQSQPAASQHLHLHSSVAAPLPASRRAAASTPTAANVISAVCPEPQAVCGYVTVPLDYAHPNGRTLQIYFEQYVHSAPGPAVSAIFANFGGPGATVTGGRDFDQYLFGPDLDVHDLVLIDDRGTGLSATIHCSELQHGTAPLAQAEADCAEQLGDSASRYGSGDIAQDMDEVRAALGYNQVDYFGASYGGMDVVAYATRFGAHLRSVVLDAPLGPPGANEFMRLRFRTHSDPRMVRLVCARSLLCGPEHPGATSEFAALIESIQQHPIEGSTFDASGNPMYVRVDETALLNFVVTYPENFVNTGEILAAARALTYGDTAPLLRLDAEGIFSDIGDSGNPTGFSAGDFYASACVTTGQAWDWSESISQRRGRYDEAVAELPVDYFAPFSNSAPTGILFSDAGLGCLWWQEPTPATPLTPPHPRYPSVPTLVLDGDIDNRVPLEETKLVAGLFPHYTFVTIPEAGHETVGYSLCAQSLVAKFIEKLSAGDPSCADTPELVFPAVGNFPILAYYAHPAQVASSGSNQIGIKERKVVTVAVAAAIDALQRSIIGSGTGVGLRGGTFQTTFGASWTTTLANCAFSTDVLVNGTVIWGADNSIDADLAVSGPGTAGGTLHVRGFWQVPGPVGNFTITGALGGQHVAVLVPEA